MDGKLRDRLKALGRSRDEQPPPDQALIAQPGRGALAAQTVRGARILLGIVALATFSAAATIVVLSDEDTQRTVWMGLMITAWVVTILLAAGLIQRVAETRAVRRHAANGPEAEEGF